MRPVFRVPPKLPVQAMKTYAIDSPKATHWRTVDCDEYGCATSAAGWQTVVDEATNLGQRQAHYIRQLAGRPYTVTNTNGLTVFLFPAGTECFQEHQVKVGRPDIFTVRGGDWRGIIGGTRTHDTPDNWVDDFAEHQDNLATRLNQG